MEKPKPIAYLIFSNCMKKILLFFGLLFFSIQQGEGQACCSGGTPLSGSLGLQYSTKGTVLAGLIYDFNTQKNLVSGGNSLADNPRARNSHSVLGRFGYAFSDRWMGMALFSLVQQEEVTTNPLTGEKREQIARGVGDIVLFSQYSALVKEEFDLLLGAGLEMPVGTTTQSDELTGLPYHPDMQPGRGAWALIGSARMALYRVLRPTMSVSFQATYRYTTTADRFEGLQEYQFGNELRLLTGIADRFMLGTVFLDPSVLILYRNTEVDLINGLPSPNTSGNWLHLRPGLQFVLTPEFQIGGFVEFPLWWNLEGTQLTTSLRTRISAQYQFGGNTMGF
jgi:hypothetical protein